MFIGIPLSGVPWITFYRACLRYHRLASCRVTLILHSSMWDDGCMREDGCTLRLVEVMSSAGMTCVNDPFTPTWYRQGSPPSVLDLVWVHDIVLEAARFNCFFRVDGALVDHLRVSLRFSADGSAPRFQRQWYIPWDSQREHNFVTTLRTCFYFFIFLLIFSGRLSAPAEAFLANRRLTARSSSTQDRCTASRIAKRNHDRFCGTS